MDAVARSVAVGEARLLLSGKAKRAAKKSLMRGGGALEGSCLDGPKTARQ